MSLIYIQGYREPVEVDKAIAEKISQAFNNKDIPETSVISTSQWTGRKSQIRSVRITNDYVAPSTGDTFIEDTRKYRNGVLSKPVEYRANSLNFFEMLYWGFTGKLEIGEEIKKKAYEIQLQFFKQNPRRLYPDPYLFKEIIGGGVCNKYILDVVERSIRADRSFR